MQYVGPVVLFLSLGQILNAEGFNVWRRAPWGGIDFPDMDRDIRTDYDVIHEPFIQPNGKKTCISLLSAGYDAIYRRYPPLPVRCLLLAYYFYKLALLQLYLLLPSLLLLIF